MSQPIKGEKKDDFLKRCMQEQERVDSFPKEDQRFAVCKRVWDTHWHEALKIYKDAFAEKTYTDYPKHEQLNK
jgi:hypothetical protein